MHEFYRVQGDLRRDARVFRPRLSDADIQYLRALPVRKTLSVGRQRIEMVHATPRSPLFEYLHADADKSIWRDALGYSAGSADLVLLGHTHLPFTLRIGRTLVVNPGSLGQPKDGDPRGCYAVLDNDRVELRRVAYDVEKAISRLRELDLESAHIEQLAGVLRGARVPTPILNDDA